ncbi:MAG: hypothetical protein MK101_10540 [Phycisphaerales bacterium]|nr:hypothetical protein [Phycisphaerales bacterium]
MGTRIAMISGPRTVSTAMLRSWGSRSDTALWDEPFYAHYLDVTGKAHPGRDVVLQAHAHERDADAVSDRITGEIPNNCDIWYQKHIAQHLLPDVNVDWVEQVRCAFLIRDPARMLASLWKRYPEATLSDTGLEQQVAIFNRLREAGFTPPVIDSDDVRRDPSGVLRALCRSLDVPFVPSMLSWPPGPRETDGAWGPYWYDVVWASEGFAPPPDDDRPIFNSPAQQDVLSHCMALYDQLAQVRLTGD